MSATDRQVAEAAWAGFARGCELGDWESFMDLLRPDVVFFLPSGAFRGRNEGRDRFRKFADLVSSRGRLRFEPPIRISGSAGTFVFEAWDEGHIDGRPIRNRIALSIDVIDDQVREFREYLGQIG